MRADFEFIQHQQPLMTRMKTSHITIAASALGFLIAGALGATAGWLPSTESRSLDMRPATHARQEKPIRIVGAPYMRDDGILLLGAAEARAK